MTDETSVSFESFDGVALEGTFRRVDGAARAMCLMIHGLTADRHEWGTFDRVAAMLANQGVCSLRFDYRCHGAAGNIPDRDLTLAGIECDLDAAYSALKEQTGSELPLVLVGASFGGGVGARWLRFRHRGAAPLLILFYPVLDYLADLERVNGSWRSEVRASDCVSYGPKALGRPYLCEVNSASMYETLEGAARCTLIYHGEDDSDVPIAEPRRARDQSPVIKLHEIPGCDHGFAAKGDPDLESDESQRNVARVVEKLAGHLAEIDLS